MTDSLVVSHGSSQVDSAQPVVGAAANLPIAQTNPNMTQSLPCQTFLTTPPPETPSAVVAGDGWEMIGANGGSQDAGYARSAGRGQPTITSGVLTRTGSAARAASSRSVTAGMQAMSLGAQNDGDPTPSGGARGRPGGGGHGCEVGGAVTPPPRVPLLRRLPHSLSLSRSCRRSR